MNLGNNRLHFFFFFCFPKIGQVGGGRCHCAQQQEQWTRNGNTQNNQDSVCVSVNLEETTESQGHVYTTIAGESSGGYLIMTFCFTLFLKKLKTNVTSKSLTR